MSYFAHSRSHFLVPQFNSALGFVYFAYCLLMTWAIELPRVAGFQLRAYSGNGTNFYFGRKGEAGIEDCAELRLKSDTLLLHSGKDNEEDFVLRPDGTKCFGKKDSMGNTIKASVIHAIEMEKAAKKAKELARKESSTPLLS